jgi:hypothetical protein
MQFTPFLQAQLPEEETEAIWRVEDIPKVRDALCRFIQDTAEL